MPSALKPSKERTKSIVQILLLGRELRVDGCKGRGVLVERERGELPELQTLETFHAAILWETKFPSGNYLQWALLHIFLLLWGSSTQHSDHPASYGAAWQRKYLFRGIITTICIVLKGKHFFRNHYWTQRLQTGVSGTCDCLWSAQSTSGDP